MIKIITKEMNLLPEEHLFDLQQKQKRRKHIIIVSLILFVLIASYLTIYFIETNIKKQIANVNSKIESLEKIKDAQIEISANQQVLDRRMNMLEKIEDKGVDHFNFFNELEKTLPEYVSLTSLTHPSGDNFNLSGKTTKDEGIGELMVNISKIKGVENVFLDGISYNKDQAISSFNIYFTYSNQDRGDGDDS